MKETEKMLALVMCFAISCMWGAFETSQGIPPHDQVILSLIFSASIIYKIFKRDKK